MLGRSKQRTGQASWPCPHLLPSSHLLGEKGARGSPLGMDTWKPALTFPTHSGVGAEPRSGPARIPHPQAPPSNHGLSGQWTPQVLVGGGRGHSLLVQARLQGREQRLGVSHQSWEGAPPAPRLSASVLGRVCVRVQRSAGPVSVHCEGLQGATRTTPGGLQPGAVLHSQQGRGGCSCSPSHTDLLSTDTTAPITTTCHVR